MTTHQGHEASPKVANHHADHPGFSGISGYVAGLTMVLGRAPAGHLAADLTGLAAGDHVVDVGCGPGAAARVAAKRGAKVTAVDPAVVMLNLARWTPGSDDVDWVEGVAESLPLLDESADIVWSLATIHHWPDLEGGLVEAHRVLRPGGRLLGIERKTKPGAKGLASHGWTSDQAERFADDCRNAGFVDVTVSTHRPRRTTQLAVLARQPA